MKQNKGNYTLKDIYVHANVVSTVKSLKGLRASLADLLNMKLQNNRRFAVLGEKSDSNRTHKRHRPVKNFKRRETSRTNL